MSNYVTAIGLNVHARSIKACALNPMTGEVRRASFGYDPAPVAEWAPSGSVAGKAAYEPSDQLHLCRALRALGLDCASGPSRRCSARPLTAAARPTAATPSSSPACRDAQRRRGLGARQAHRGGPRPLPRAQRRRAATAARQAEDVEVPLRHGHVFDEPDADRRAEGAAGRGRTGGGPTRSSSSRPDDAAAYEHYRDCVRRCGEARDALARRVAESAGRPAGSRPWTRSGA